MSVELQGLVEMFKTAVTATQKQYDQQNADNYIMRVKNAEVIWYQPMKCIACVRFLEDRNKNEYHLYNRCGAFLSAGDKVKVYYTTNAAKGWIAVRCGTPNYLNEYGQNIADIKNCCDEDNGDNERCCSNNCFVQQTGRDTNKDVVTTEEWDERIEGSEEEVREYEEREGKENPFKYYSPDDSSQ